MPELVPAFVGWIKEHTTPARRRKLAHARLKLRRVTASRRVLPDVLIIGAQRCGTSSLYKYLGAHPQVIPSLRKEVEYFSTSFLEGEDWYRAHFPLKERIFVRRVIGSGAPITFEATPDYLLDPRAAERAAHLVPEARIIVALRNPVARAFSQYQHNRRLGLEPLSFEEALDCESERIDGEVERLLEDPAYRAYPLRRHGYVARGKYAEQITRWQAWFPPEQILFVRFEDLTADPRATLLAIERFLGLDPWQPKSFANHSYGRSGRVEANAMAGSTQQRLEQVFAPYDEQLDSLVGFQPGWRSTPAGGERRADT